MKSFIPFFCTFLLACTFLSGCSQSDFNAFFTDQTMRVDYTHSGTKGEESYSVDDVLIDGPWPGSRVNLVDTLNLGEYRFSVYEGGTDELIYSRGFSTIFNEWQTTDEAASGVKRGFSETLRFPFPKNDVRVAISRRDGEVFHELFSTNIDPGNPDIHEREKEAPSFESYAVIENGPPHTKVDIVILGDGYAREDMETFRQDVERYNTALFETEPFKSRMTDFNVWVVEVESDSSGVSIPDISVFRRTPLGTSYNTFGSPRYILTEANEDLRDIAALVPYDFICILVNDTRYGGGGIYNLYATTYMREQTESQQWQMDYVYVHEFGHSFGGLGDEYYSSSTAYNEFYPPGVEPWEPNVTALIDPGNVKWSHLATEGIEIPTPWKKAVYDSLERERGKLNRLADDYYEKREPLYQAAMGLLANSEFKGMVGAFRGAGYASEGLYRPAVDCRMFSLSLVDFDPVCSEAIHRMIDFFSR